MILIGRGLNHGAERRKAKASSRSTLALCSCQGAKGEGKPGREPKGKPPGRARKISGDNSEREPPVPIPNTEVKPLSADGTWLETARESRTLPEYKRELEKLDTLLQLSKRDAGDRDKIEAEEKSAGT